MHDEPDETSQRRRLASKHVKSAILSVQRPLLLGALRLEWDLVCLERSANIALTFDNVRFQRLAIMLICHSILWVRRRYQPKCRITYMSCAQNCLTWNYCRFRSFSHGISIRPIRARVLEKLFVSFEIPKKHKLCQFFLLCWTISMTKCSDRV